jgi:hypothetical protein
MGTGWLPDERESVDGKHPSLLRPVLFALALLFVVLALIWALSRLPE